MSVIPEVILQRAIIAGFRAMREDSRILDAIFRHMNQDQLANIKSFVLDTPIDFSINFPRKEPSLPSLVLLLKHEVRTLCVNHAIAVLAPDGARWAVPKAVLILL